MRSSAECSCDHKEAAAALDLYLYRVPLSSGDLTAWRPPLWQLINIASSSAAETIQQVSLACLPSSPAPLLVAIVIDGRW